MGVVIMIAQLILALTILVTIHEWGHYITAKWFNVQVDKFFIFFDVPIGRGKRKENQSEEEYKEKGWDGKVVKKQEGETEYGFGWLPLGGYVKLAGMIDESMDTDFEKVPEDRQFRFKPAWQKLIIMLAGIFMNVVLGCLIFFGLNLSNKSFLPLDKLGSEYIVSQYSKDLGMQQGDQIIGANGKEMMRLDDIRKDVFFGGTVQVKRGEEILSIDIPENFFEAGESLVYLKDQMLVAEIAEGEGAEKAGLAINDIILSAANTPIQASGQFKEILQNNIDKTISIAVDRNGNTQNLSIPVDEEGKIGFVYAPQIDGVYQSLFTKMSVGEALKYGVKDAFDMIILNAKAFALIGKGKIKAQDSVAGPAQIATMFGAQWNWTRFWTLTGSLSMILAFMNLLPIPALDGGHAVFAIVEMITGKRVNEKVLIAAQTVGFFLIMALMIFIIGNDAVKIGSGLFGK